jgi:hypothetical protein
MKAAHLRAARKWRKPRVKKGWGQGISFTNITPVACFFQLGPPFYFLPPPNNVIKI